MLGNSFIQSLAAKFGRVAMAAGTLPFHGIGTAANLMHATVSGLFVSPVGAKFAFENALVGLWQLGFQRRIFSLKLRNSLFKSGNFIHQFSFLFGCGDLMIKEKGGNSTVFAHIG